MADEENKLKKTLGTASKFALPLFVVNSIAAFGIAAINSRPGQDDPVFWPRVFGYFVALWAVEAIAVGGLGVAGWMLYNATKRIIGAKVGEGSTALKGVPDKVPTTPEEYRTGFLSFGLIPGSNGGEASHYMQNTDYNTIFTPLDKGCITFDFPETEARNQRLAACVRAMIKKEKPGAPVDLSLYYPSPYVMRLAYQIDSEFAKRLDITNFAKTYYDYIWRGCPPAIAAYKTFGSFVMCEIGKPNNFRDAVVYVETNFGAFVLYPNPNPKQKDPEVLKNLKDREESLVRYSTKFCDNSQKGGDVWASSVDIVSADGTVIEQWLSFFVSQSRRRYPTKTIFETDVAKMLADTTTDVHKNSHQQEEPYLYSAFLSENGRPFYRIPRIPNSRLVRCIPKYLKEFEVEDNIAKLAISLRDAIAETQESLDHAHHDLNPFHKKNWPDEVGVQKDQQNLRLLMDLRFRTAHLSEAQQKAIRIPVPSDHGDVDRKLLYTMLTRYIVLNDAKVEEGAVVVKLKKDQHMPVGGGMVEKRELDDSDFVTHTIAIPDELFLNSLSQMASNAFPPFDSENIHHVSAALKQAYRDVIECRDMTCKWGDGAFRLPGALVSTRDLETIATGGAPQENWDLLTRRLQNLRALYQMAIDYQHGALCNASDPTLKAALLMASEVHKGELPGELRHTEEYTDPGEFLNKNLGKLLSRTAHNREDLKTFRKWRSPSPGEMTLPVLMNHKGPDYTPELNN